MRVKTGLERADESEVEDELAPVNGAVGIDGETIETIEGIDAVKARLAARGLLVSGPAIVVPKVPRPDKPVVLDDVLAEVDADHHPNAVPEDDWDVEPEGSGMVSVRCPQCRGAQQTPSDVTRFRCFDCERAWRWAVCGECDAVAFTVERQESWRCGDCGHFNRSWWRTGSAGREALAVVGRRRDLAAQAERAQVRAGMRKRRWKIVAGAVAGLVLVLGFVVVVRMSEPTEASGTSATCRHFEDLRSDLASGTIGPAALADSLDELAAKSNGAASDVASAVADLGAAGQPSKATFLVASTKLADACTKAGF